jgi:hypothetical protein
MDPETNTVVQCLRVFLSSADGALLRESLASTADWNKLETKAASHSIAPVVSNVLLEYASDLGSQEVLQRCKRRLNGLAKKNILWLQEWQRLMQTFDRAAIPVISFKGPALALGAYGNLGLREFHDLDFLVHPRNVPRTRDKLLAEDYTLWSPVVGNRAESLLLSKNRQLRFTNRTRGTCVDVHWGLLHEMFPFQLDVEQAFKCARWERSEEAEFLSLSPEYLLLYLCAHGTKNCWSQLSELCDVAVHLQSQSEMDWDGCIRLAEATGCGLLLKHALLLCERVLRIELPEMVKHHCRQDETAIGLSNAAEKFLCLQGEVRPDYFRTLRYHLAFAKTWRERLRLIFVRVFSPAEPDWQHIKLPRPLFGFYYLIRPLRFLREEKSRLM